MKTLREAFESVLAQGIMPEDIIIVTARLIPDLEELLGHVIKQHVTPYCPPDTQYLMHAREFNPYRWPGPHPPSIKDHVMTSPNILNRTGERVLLQINTGSAQFPSWERAPISEYTIEEYSPGLGWAKIRDMDGRRRWIDTTQARVVETLIQHAPKDKEKRPRVLSVMDQVAREVMGDEFDAHKRLIAFIGEKLPHIPPGKEPIADTAIRLIGYLEEEPLKLSSFLQTRFPDEAGKAERENMGACRFAIQLLGDQRDDLARYNTQVNRLAQLLMEQFSSHGPKDEGAIDMAMRVLMEQKEKDALLRIHPCILRTCDHGDAVECIHILREAVK